MPPHVPRSLSRPKNTYRAARIAASIAVAAASVGLLTAAAPASAHAPAPASPLEHGSARFEVTQVQRALHVHIAPETTSETASSSQTPADTGGSSSSGSGGYSIPSGIVDCESGGNYSAVNSSSGAGGAYQIMPSTWQAYGGQGLPQDAPKSEQDHIAAEIYARQGPSAWTC